jgi:hypothetical protein
MKEAIKAAKNLDQKYQGRIARHNKTGNYYFILGIRPFCCSINPSLEGEIIVEYARDGEHYARFLDDFFGFDLNIKQPRFEIVPEKEKI